MLQVALRTSLSSFSIDLNFEAAVGQTTVLLGESGAGKSTVLRFLAGLLHPQQGHISFMDVTYFDSTQHTLIPARNRPFGYVFQDYALFPHLSVFENIAFGLQTQHISRQIIRQRVGSIIEKMRLTGLERRRPSQLSGGQQQRVAIGRALVLQPDLLLLDEPLSALDIQTRREIRQELRQILAEIQTTTVMVTHQYLEALLFAHQILVLDQGRIVQQGNQHTLLQTPRSSYIAELVGTNFFHGNVMRSTIQTDQVVYTLQFTGLHAHYIELQVSVTKQEMYDEALVTGEEAYVIVNPTSIHVQPEQSTELLTNTFSGEIVQLLHMKKHSARNSYEDTVAISILTDECLQPINAEVPLSAINQMHLCEGKRVTATFHPEDAKIYR